MYVGLRATSEDKSRSAKAVLVDAMDGRIDERWSCDALHAAAHRLPVMVYSRNRCGSTERRAKHLPSVLNPRCGSTNATVDCPAPISAVFLARGGPSRRVSADPERSGGVDGVSTAGRLGAFGAGWSFARSPCRARSARFFSCISNETRRGLGPSVVVARVRLVTDFRSDRMESPEGRGIARRAWDGYTGAVGKVATPALRPLVRLYAAGSIVDLIGFWAVWHLEGGFEGLRRMGMSRASIYRRVKLFRVAFGAHPDEFVMPGITLDVEAYRSGWAEWSKAKAEAEAKAKSQSLRPSVRPSPHSLIYGTFVLVVDAVPAGRRGRWLLPSARPSLASSFASPTSRARWRRRGGGRAGSYAATAPRIGSTGWAR